MIIIVGILIVFIFFLISFFIYKAFQEKHFKNCLYLILFLGLAIRTFMASDPYLHKWDERFHALVAKNLVAHPLKPTLYDNPVYSYKIKDWVGNHIWLTKPTLPLWCMAASIKVFGLNEYSIRVPSVLISLFCVFMTFFIGKNLFGIKLGLVAGYLHAIHGLTVELAGGVVSSDHVETFLLAFVQAGILFAIFYLKSNSKKHLIGVGICTGLAFLSKWISGFIIIFVFAVFLFQKKRSFKEIYFISFLVGGAFLLITSPWIIYVLKNYPQESEYIIGQFLSPIQKGVEGHTGSALYYLDKIRILFGELIYLPLVWLGYKYFSKKKASNISLLFYWIIIPLVLLSIADMKRHTYILVSSPAFFLLIPLCIRYIQINKNKIQLPSIVINIVLILLIALPIRYSLERIKPLKARVERPEWYQGLNIFSKKLETDPSKIILIGETHYVEAMFYFPFIAYDYIPTNAQIEQTKAKGYRVFENFQNNYIER